MIDDFLRSVRSKMENIKRWNSVNMPTQRVPAFTSSDVERLLRLVEHYRKSLETIVACEERECGCHIEAKLAVRFSGEEGE